MLVYFIVDLLPDILKLARRAQIPLDCRIIDRAILRIRAQSLEPLTHRVVPFPLFSIYYTHSPPYQAQFISQLYPPEQKRSPYSSQTHLVVDIQTSEVHFFANLLLVSGRTRGDHGV